MSKFYIELFPQNYAFLRNCGILIDTLIIIYRELLVFAITSLSQSLKQNLSKICLPPLQNFLS